MKIISVQPKDILVNCEMSLTQIGYIIEFLNRCVVRFDGDKEPEFKTISDYITKTFYTQLKNVYNEIQGEK